MDCFTDERNVLDWQRIMHLLKIGIIAALIVLTGDMILGWGISDPAAAEIPAVLSRYLSVSDGRIFVSSLLGLIGIPIECLCWFAVIKEKGSGGEQYDKNNNENRRYDVRYV